MTIVRQSVTPVAHPDQVASRNRQESIVTIVMPVKKEVAAACAAYVITALGEIVGKQDKELDGGAMCGVSDGW